MATPERKTREFGPDAQARRAAKAEREERLKATALASLDVGKGWSGPGRAPGVVDAGIAEAVATSSERVALRTARGGREIQQAQRQLATKKADLRAQQPAGKAASKPRLRDRLERMSESERLDVVESMRPGRERDYVAGLVASIAEIEEDVEFEHATWLEEQQLAAYEDAEEEEVVVDEDGVSWPASYTAEERQAVIDVAAANAQPVYSDDLEDAWGIEDEEEGGEE
jgi:hypothetical protein